MDAVSDFDRAMITRCLELARQARRPSPNPFVGSVIVRDGAVIGEGFHPGAGQPHAEVFALRAAGDRSRGATLYVNLEPCNHHGRTPPCSEAVIAAGIHRVVVGMVDPDPRTAGQGIERLRQAGLEVTVGVEEAACRELNAAFCHRIRSGQPFGVLKYAMTLDGHIAATSGHSQWVTGPEARARVHQLRATVDAVIVGGNTLRQDNPALTLHGQMGEPPLRVVLSRRLELPTEAQLWEAAIAPTLVFTGLEADPAIARALEQQGVTVVVLPDCTPALAARELARRGCNRVLWECGGTLAAAALQEHCIQEVWAFIAPKLIGASPYGPMGELGLTRMDEAIALKNLTVETVGPDLLVKGRL